MKKFFTFIACALVALSANAKEVAGLTAADLSNGWDSEYDETTKTIDYTGGWSGRGWGLSQPGELYAIEADYFVIEVESSEVPFKLVAEYTDGKPDDKGNLKNVGESVSDVASKDDKYLAVKLNSEDFEYIIQIYIQNFSENKGKLVLKDAFYLTDEEFEAYKAAHKSNTLWEGNQNFGTGWEWETHLELAASEFADLKAGDVLKFGYVANGDAEYSQIKVQAGGKNLENAEVNEWDCITLPMEGKSTSVKLTAEDVKNLKASGMKVTGYNSTLTSVEVAGPTTGISSAVVAPQAKSSKIYNLAGQQVSKSYKGVVIKNGKKYVQ